MTDSLHFYPLSPAVMRKDLFDDEADKALMNHDYELVHKITGQDGLNVIEAGTSSDIQEGYYLALYDGYYTMISIHDGYFSAFGCYGEVNDLLDKFELIGPITPAGIYEYF
jgi:hypothetical protein